MKNIIESIYYFICGHGRGWAFSSSDLLNDYDKMQEMIFAKHLAFAEVIESLRVLENEINALSRQG